MRSDGTVLPSASSCTIVSSTMQARCPPPTHAEEAEALKAKEAQHWEQAKQLGDQVGRQAGGRLPRACKRCRQRRVDAPARWGGGGTRSDLLLLVRVQARAQGQEETQRRLAQVK